MPPVAAGEAPAATGGAAAASRGFRNVLPGAGDAAEPHDHLSPASRRQRSRRNWKERVAAALCRRNRLRPRGKKPDGVPKIIHHQPEAAGNRLGTPVVDRHLQLLAPKPAQIQAQIVVPEGGRP
jgi:hypothetical protein